MFIEELGADMEEPGAYNMGTTGAGTCDWRCVRKYFSPRKPVRSLRLFLCARGFDGTIVEKNRVGTVWCDEIQLFEHGVPHVQYARFLAVSVLALLIDLVALALLVEVFGVHKPVAAAIAIVVATPISFLGNKLWSFR